MVKRCRRDPEIGIESQFGPNSMMEFEAKIPKKIGLPNSVHLTAYLPPANWSLVFGETNGRDQMLAKIVYSELEA